jgi:hypothetical protein
MIIFSMTHSIIVDDLFEHIRVLLDNTIDFYVVVLSRQMQRICQTMSISVTSYSNETISFELVLIKHRSKNRCLHLLYDSIGLIMNTSHSIDALISNQLNQSYISRSFFPHVFLEFLTCVTRHWHISCVESDLCIEIMWRLKSCIFTSFSSLRQIHALYEWRIVLQTIIDNDYLSSCIYVFDGCLNYRQMLDPNLLAIEMNSDLLIMLNVRSYSSSKDINWN